MPLQLLVPTTNCFGGTLKRLVCSLTLALLAASSGLLAQTSSSTDSSQSPTEPTTPAPPISKAATEAPEPFSRLAVSGGVGVNGINMQVAVEATRNLNIRGIGNYFSYTLSKTSDGTVESFTLHFATGGVSVDYYPFPNHGLRISPGVQFYNQNGLSGTLADKAGHEFTVNKDTYYASPTSPPLGNGSIALNSTNPAFTLTTGWGNLISRKGGHFSVPFEIGAAFVGSPTVHETYTSGYVCTDDTYTSCTQSAATDEALTMDLAAQDAKDDSDASALKVWPIMSIGIGYNFNIR